MYGFPSYFKKVILCSFRVSLTRVMLWCQGGGWPFTIPNVMFEIVVFEFGTCFGLKIFGDNILKQWMLCVGNNNGKGD
jgi:hypothetical protein